MIGEKSSTFANNLLKLIFNNAAIAGLGDTAGLQPSAAAGNLYVSLHLSDPTAAGNQSTNEVSYTGYARVAAARGSFVVTGNSVSPASPVVFGIMTAGTGGAVTFFGVGTAASGSGQLLYTGPISPSIICANGSTPQLAPLNVTEN